MKRPSPLTGYNTGVQHRGAPYHVQTEDSGVDHPHVITHLFAHGGRIVATRKTSYAEHVGTPAYPAVVHQLIRAQHKEMIVRLRDGDYDALLGHTGPAPMRAPAATRPSAAPAPRPPPLPVPQPERRATPAVASPRSGRSSFPRSESASDSLDEIIISDLMLHFDE